MYMHKQTSTQIYIYRKGNGFHKEKEIKKSIREYYYIIRSSDLGWEQVRD